MTTSALPVPQNDDLQIRLATLDDAAWIDSMQKKNSKALGFMPMGQIEGKIGRGNVLIAEASVDCGMSNVGNELRQSTFDDRQSRTRLGYIIGQDQYFKRDDVGIIYAINVAPEGRRRCVAARLVKALIERCAWGCKLMSCWVAQDLEANKFWEAMGFVPVAFRTGAKRRVGTAHRARTVGGAHPTGRTHIFWQLRIRQGDATTPYWFPSQTGGGAIREDRLVLPIPPGVGWEDEMPSVLPESSETGVSPRRLDAKASKTSPVGRTGLGTARAPAGRRPLAQPQGLWFATEPVNVTQKKEKLKREKKKNDPKLIAAAREIRDRWMELQLTGRSPAALGKYEVGRQMSHGLQACATGSETTGTGAALRLEEIVEGKVVAA